MTAVAILALLVVAAGPAWAQERGTIRSVIHVHSTRSTGALTLDDLAQAAAREGIGAVLLAENFHLRVAYGLPPFRALTTVTHAERHVAASGVREYLAAVAAAQQRTPGVLLVPGVEVTPHYRWSGSPFTLDMTLHDSQKNLLVFGLDAPALASLPTIGNRVTAGYGWQSLADALPVALVIPGIALIVRKRTRRVRVGRAVALVRRRRWALGLTVVAIGIVALVRGWPFRVDRHPSWTDPGVAPYQDVIDHVDRAGGAVVWSFPEAREDGVRTLGPIHVRHRTAPHADDLERTVRYTGFGAVYEDTTRFERPGGGWDRLLTRYVAGARSRPVWAIGEAGFHDFRAGTLIGTVQTVFLDTARSAAGVVDSLAHGRMYALRRAPDFGLELGEFAVVAGADTAATAATLRASPGSPLDIRVAVVTSVGRAHPVRVTLVRNGTVVAAWSGTTPFAAVHRETFDFGRGYYRLDVRGGGPHHLVTNPIFVSAR
jgi:hypothetical protein